MTELTPYLARRLRSLAEAEAARARALRLRWGLGEAPTPEVIAQAVARAEAGGPLLRDDAARLRWLNDYLQRG